MRPFLIDALKEVGLAGFIDILLTAVLVYNALSWLRASRAIRALQGVVILGAVYGAARMFQLTLTVAALEALFIVVVVSAIVIFRDEVRVAVERIARFGRGARRGPTRPAYSLSQTLFDLAGSRIGALVVIEGRERLDDLLEGGTQLDGLHSDALLKSIFDPTSVGHDGALVLRAGRVLSFRCHLPLSSNFEQLDHRGTRHAAALGLSERSDALVLVVSEERGTVSVAHDGMLKTVLDPVELEAVLDAFEHKVYPDIAAEQQPRRRVRTAFFAIVIATLLWVVAVYGARSVQRSFVVPLSQADLDLPVGYRLASVSPSEVRVTLSGARSEFFFVDEKSVVVTLPLRDAPKGRSEVHLDPSGVTVPGAVTVKSVSPSRAIVTVAAQ